MRDERLYIFYLILNEKLRVMSADNDENRNNNSFEDLVLEDSILENLVLEELYPQFVTDVP